MIGAKFPVALNDDFGENLEAGLEAQGFAVVNVQVGNLRLRHWNHSLLFRLFAEITRNQGLDHIALQVFLEALADDRRGYVAGAEARQARHLLIFLYDFFHLARDFFGGDFDRNLAFDAVFVLRVDCLCGTHVCPFGLFATSDGTGIRLLGPVSLTRR